jgi:DNA-binding MarR family transcriptional regulator
MTDLARKLIETVPRVRQILVASLRRHGVRHSIPQLQILTLVADRPRTVTELAELQGVTKATISATLSRMAGQGLVRRNRALHDQRQVIVLPTANGRAVSEAAKKKAAAILDGIVACLSPEEKDVLMSGLELLMRAVERAPDAHPDE